MNIPVVAIAPTEVPGRGPDFCIDAADVQLDSQIKQIPHIRLVSLLRSNDRLEELCVVLDAYWKEFANHPKVTTYPEVVEHLEQEFSVNPNLSPSRQIVSNWQHSVGSTVANFLSILKDIHCNEGAVMILDWVKSFNNN
mmetsp:Transcript_5342/g.7502  ORF Transcript_5342/g.7502 Transcript_5342/m.7502 type:complete len:139 (-) Transcript_5342:114-530(-)